MDDSSRWEDCIALLKSGAPPTQVLPNLRALFQTLPGANDNSQRNDGTMATDPSPELSKNLVRQALTFQLDRKYPPFPIPYLRPPPFLWDLLRDSDGTFSPEASVFDSEIDFPVLKAFRPRIIPPPPSAVRALLDDQLSWQPSTTDSGTQSQKNVQINSQSQQVYNVSPPSGTTPIPTEQALVQATRVRQASNDLSSALRLSPKADDVTHEQSAQFPFLDTDGWSVAVSGVDPKCVLCLTAVERLLRQVNQPAFATVVLFSWLPLLMLSEYPDASANQRADVQPLDESERFLEVLQLAASLSNISGWPKVQLAALTELYQAVDKDSPLPALAQITILRIAAQS